ncbi:MAG: hypothetical protein Q9221_008251 [Calogaya cf. arnoldii]
MSRNADLDRLNQLAAAINAQVMVIRGSLAEHPDSPAASIVRNRMADQAFSHLTTMLPQATAGIQRLTEAIESEFNHAKAATEELRLQRQALADKEKARFQERQKKLDEREKKIEEREKNIDVQYGRMWSRENDLITRDKELSARDKELNSRDKELNSREQSTTAAGIAKIENSISGLALQSQQQANRLAEDVKGISTNPSAIPAAAISNEVNALKASIENVIQQPSSATIDEFRQMVQAVETNVVSAMHDKIVKPMDEQGVALGIHIQRLGEKLPDETDTYWTDVTSRLDSISGKIDMKEVLAAVDSKLEEILSSSTKLETEVQHMGVNVQHLEEALPNDTDTDTYWTGVTSQLSSISGKIDTITRRLTATNISTSSPSEAARKRHSDTEHNERDSSRLRRDSQQSLAGGSSNPSSSRPDSPIMPRSTRTVVASSQTGDMSERLRQTWNQIQFEGEGWNGKQFSNLFSSQSSHQ